MILKAPRTCALALDILGGSAKRTRLKQACGRRGPQWCPRATARTRGHILVATKMFYCRVAAVTEGNVFLRIKGVCSEGLASDLAHPKAQQSKDPAGG